MDDHSLSAGVRGHAVAELKNNLAGLNSCDKTGSLQDTLYGHVLILVDGMIGSVLHSNRSTNRHAPQSQ